MTKLSYKIWIPLLAVLVVTVLGMSFVTRVKTLGVGNSYLNFNVNEKHCVVMMNVEYVLTENFWRGAYTTAKIVGPMAVIVEEDAKSTDWLAPFHRMETHGEWKTKAATLYPGKVYFVSGDGYKTELGDLPKDLKISIEGEWKSDPCGKILATTVFDRKTLISSKLEQILYPPNE